MSAGFYAQRLRRSRRHSYRRLAGTSRASHRPARPVRWKPITTNRFESVSDADASTRASELLHGPSIDRGRRDRLPHPHFEFISMAAMDSCPAAYIARMTGRIILVQRILPLTPGHAAPSTPRHHVRVIVPSSLGRHHTWMRAADVNSPLDHGSARQFCLPASVSYKDAWTVGTDHRP